MNQPEAPFSPRRHALTAAIASAIATSVILWLFSGMAGSCAGLGCMSLVLFYPLSAIAAALAAIVVGAYAGRGCNGQVEGMFWAAAGWLAVLVLVSATGIFRR